MDETKTGMSDLQRVVTTSVKQTYRLIMGTHGEEVYRLGRILDF
jgi:hypothetical protein